MLTQNIPVGQTPPEDPAYVEAMIAKVDGTPEPVTTEQKEEGKLLAGKYKTAEDLEKAYKELEKKLGQRVTPPPNTETPPAEDTENQNDGENDDDQQNTDTSPKGFEAFYEEYERDGKLSDESYKALSDMGLSKELVDAHIEGQKALATSKAQSVYAIAGGEDEYGNMIAWAAVNMKESQKVAFNDALASDDLDVIAIAVKGLTADYRAAKGTPPKGLLDGTEGSTAPTNVFRSTAELTAAMSDPRYHRDPAFRKEVEEKLSRSDIL